MGLDYSFLLFFIRQDPWELMDGVASFADWTLDKPTAIYFPDRIMRLPFEAWAGTEKLLPIPYNDNSKEWNFITSLYFKADDEITQYVDHWEEQVQRLDGKKNWHAPKDHQRRVSIGYIYLTVRNEWSGFGEAFDPSLLMLQFTAATSNMSILFAQSYSMRAAFACLLENHKGVYGLIDREEDAVLFWLRGEEMNEVIPYAWMSLPEIEDYLQKGGKDNL